MVEFTDHDFYIKEFHGSTIPETAFPNAALKASIFIKYLTFGRVSDSFAIDYPQYADEIKMAVCATAEVMYKEQMAAESMEADGREKKSETVGNVSISYVTEGKEGELREKTMERKQYAAAYPYLIHTGLMYRGVRE